MKQRLLRLARMTQELTEKVAELPKKQVKTAKVKLDSTQVVNFLKFFAKDM